MKAVILAAGVSRRLYPLTYDIPKCLIKVGEKPIINHQLDSLKNSGIDEIIIVVGYHREILIYHINTNYPDLNINFVSITTILKRIQHTHYNSAMSR